MLVSFLAQQLWMNAVRSLVSIALAAVVSGAWLSDGVAQTGPAAQPPSGTSEPVFTPLTTRWAFPNAETVNAGTVTIITAPAGGAKSVFAADMARVLDEKDKLRILPILGKGPVQNVIDVLYLKSIDMGLVATDVPEFYKIQYGSDITERLRYIMKLYNDEIHIRCRRDLCWNWVTPSPTFRDYRVRRRGQLADR